MEIHHHHPHKFSVFCKWALPSYIVSEEWNDSLNSRFDTIHKFLIFCHFDIFPMASWPYHWLKPFSFCRASIIVTTRSGELPHGGVKAPESRVIIHVVEAIC